MNRSAKGLLMVTTNLDGFGLANHRRSPNSPNFDLTNFPAIRYLTYVINSTKYGDMHTYVLYAYY